MKEYLASLLRHALTGLAAMGGFLASKGWIEATDAPALDAAGQQLASAVVVIVSAVVARFLISGFAKILPAGAGEPGHDGGGTGKVGGLTLWFTMTTATAAVILGGALPSCALPIRARIVGPDGVVSYSSKSGLAVDAVVREEKGKDLNRKAAKGAKGTQR